MRSIGSYWKDTNGGAATGISAQAYQHHISSSAFPLEFQTSDLNSPAKVSTKELVEQKNGRCSVENAEELKFERTKLQKAFKKCTTSRWLAKTVKSCDQNFRKSPCTATLFTQTSRKEVHFISSQENASSLWSLWARFSALRRRFQTLKNVALATDTRLFDYLKNVESFY